MSLTIPKTWVSGEYLTATHLNRNFNAVKGKFSNARGGIANADVSASAAFVSTKLDLTSNTGAITQSASLSSTSPACSLFNTGNGGVLKITNSGTGASIFTDGVTIAIDLDNDANTTGESFSVTKNAEATTMMAVDADGVITGSTTETEYYAVCPSDFVGVMHSTNLGAAGNTLRITADGVSAINNATTGSGTFLPVKLPHGATVTNYTVYYVQEAAGAAMAAYLERRPFSDDVAAIMANPTLADSEVLTSATTSSITNGTIDNTTYHYQVRFNYNNTGASNSNKLYGAVITYTLSNWSHSTE